MAVTLTLACALVLGACSLVLDPDELRVGDADEVDVGAVDSDAADRDVAADTGIKDANDAADTRDGASDTDGADDDAADAAADIATEVDVAGDTVTAREVKVAHSGPIGCTLDYRIGLTGCPEACASWTYVVDAGRSVGVETFAWSFSATEGYTVEPPDANGPRVELTLGVPDCLIGGASMPAFEISARLSVDGEPAELIDLGTIHTSLVTTCDGKGACPDPL